ncbi:MAG: DUF3152 domain-containing protein [Acidimicrobiales bacterium]
MALAAALAGGLALLWSDRDHPDTDPAPPAAASSSTAPAGDGGSTASSAPTTTTTVDPGALVATDRFLAAPGGSPVVGSGPLRTYVVEVEEGIPIDPAEFAAAVDATLADQRGWTALGDVSLRRVAAEEAPSFRVRLATPATVDAHCAPLQTAGIYSCRQGADVMINVRRWLLGAAESQLSLEDYRHYVISHEVGHALGHGHAACPGPGVIAPVMLQQTKGLGGCRPNPWPYPDG